MDEENANYAAASKFSLEIVILQLSTTDGVTLTAVVNGGSGDFVYSWAYWQPDTVTTRGIIQLGDSSNAITLNLGIYNVILDVLDRKTGRMGMPQRRRLEQMVYATGVPNTNTNTNNPKP